MWNQTMNEMKSNETRQWDNLKWTQSQQCIHPTIQKKKKISNNWKCKMTQSMKWNQMKRDSGTI